MNHFAERARIFARVPRVWVVLLCAAVLAGLCLYAEREHPMRPLSEYGEKWRIDWYCLEGRPVELALPIGGTHGTRFNLYVPGGGRSISVDTRFTADGGWVSYYDRGERAAVRGRFGDGGSWRIVDAEVYVARGRKLKIAASAAAALFVLYLVLRWFRFDRKRGGFVERYDA